IDGCGKSTQIDLLKQYFDLKVDQYSVFREPGGTEISEKIRSILLHETKEMDPVTELLLFSAARSQLIAEKVEPLLKQNQIVILDRFYDSTTAYQGFGRNLGNQEQLNLLNRLASHQTVPDLTFYLKIEPEEAAVRTGDIDKDRMENSGLSFYRKVVEGYNIIATSESRFHTLDANQKPEIIHSEIVSIIETL
ncbi:MAG: dTMP kinase, partial [Candidatus Paceibacterota bacterium]